MANRLDHAEINRQTRVQYSNSKVHQNGWFRDASWREGSHEAAEPAPAPRGIGRQRPMTQAEAVARTKGHATSAITDWGSPRPWNEPEVTPVAGPGPPRISTAHEVSAEMLSTESRFP